MDLEVVTALVFNLWALFSSRAPWLERGCDPFCQRNGAESDKSSVKAIKDKVYHYICSILGTYP